MADSKLKSPIAFTVVEIAARCAGTVVGDPEIEITSVEPLFSAAPGSLTFFDPTARKSQHGQVLAAAKNSRASAILVREQLPDLPMTQIVTKNPYFAILEIAQCFNPRPLPDPGIHPTAVVDPSARLAESVRVGPYAVIGADCVLEADCIIHAHVVIYPGCRLGPGCEIHASAVLRERVVFGEDCMVQPGAVIGGDGFGYVPLNGKGFFRVPHLGSVVFGDRVDVGANSGIDRGTLGPTKIGSNTKVDSVCQIGHNNQIGERSLICGVAGIGGSGEIGNDVVIGGHVGIADHVRIADRVRVGGKSGIFRDIEAAGDYRGDPDPQPVKEHWRLLSLYRRLPELHANLRAMAKRIEELERRLEAGDK